MLNAEKIASALQNDGSVSPNRQAIVELYSTHYERMVRYFRLRIGDLQESEDLGVEVFVRALRAADSFKENGAPMEAWLFRIAHNLVVDHYRRKRHQEYPLDEVEPLGYETEPTLDIERQEDAASLNNALQHLTEAQRQVLALRFHSGLSSQEVADLLGMKDGAVREMQRRAIVRLRGLLKKA